MNSRSKTNSANHKTTQCYEICAAKSVWPWEEFFLSWSELYSSKRLQECCRLPTIFGPILKVLKNEKYGEKDVTGQSRSVCATWYDVPIHSIAFLLRLETFRWFWLRFHHEVVTKKVQILRNLENGQSNTDAVFAKIRNFLFLMKSMLASNVSGQSFRKYPIFVQILTLRLTPLKSFWADFENAEV